LLGFITNQNYAGFTTESMDLDLGGFVINLKANVRCFWSLNLKRRVLNP
jgi:hypothetical protein